MSNAALSAVILAAGESTRMGRPKMLLPWGRTTVLGRVIEAFGAAGVGEILVVTGGARREVEALVAGSARSNPVRPIFNPDHRSGGMLASIQAGLKAASPKARAALIALGDQPQIREEVIARLCTRFLETGAPLLLPSFGNRRGHPWLAARSLWPALLELPFGTTPRDFLLAHEGEIAYLPVEDDSILRDLDTPDDYENQRP